MSEDQAHDDLRLRFALATFLTATANRSIPRCSPAPFFGPWGAGGLEAEGHPGARGPEARSESAGRAERRSNSAGPSPRRSSAPVSSTPTSIRALEGEAASLATRANPEAILIWIVTPLLNPMCRV